MLRLSIIQSILLWLALSLLGVMVIGFAPDDLFGNKVLIRLSDQHGPTLIDIFGIIIALGGWFQYLYQLWIRKAGFKRPGIAVSLAVILAICVIGCLVAASQNANLLLVAFACVAFGVQLILGAIATRSPGV